MLVDVQLLTETAEIAEIADIGALNEQVLLQTPYKWTPNCSLQFFLIYKHMMPHKHEAENGACLAVADQRIAS